MAWLRRNGGGLLGLVLAVAGLGFGFFAHKYAAQRDEQARGVAIRLQRNEPDLAERHQKAAKLLGELADANRSLALYAAGAAVFVAAWSGRRANPWLTAATTALAVGALVLALEGRA